MLRVANYQEHLPSLSRSAATYQTAAIACDATEALEVYTVVTAGSGTVVTTLAVAPTSTGPWIDVGVTSSLSASGTASAVLKAWRGANGSLGMHYRITSVVSSAAATFSVNAVTA